MLDPFTIASLGLTAGSTLANIFGAKNEQDPEEIYNKRMDEAAGILRGIYAGEEDSARKAAGNQESLDRISGGRELASSGYRGSADSFMNPRVGSTRARLDAALDSIRRNKISAFGNLQMQRLNAPINIKPNTAQLIGSGLNAAATITGTLSQIDAQKKHYDNIEQELINALKGLDGRTNNIFSTGKTPYRGTDVNSDQSPQIYKFKDDWT
jgi:hypothetical protein